MICQRRRLRQIIDLRDTDKSQYFAITKFNSLLFYHSITEFIFLNEYPRKRSKLPFSCQSDCKKEKSTVSFTHVQNIICSQTQLDGTAHEQTIINFAGSYLQVTW